MMKKVRPIPATVGVLNLKPFLPLSFLVIDLVIILSLLKFPFVSLTMFCVIAVCNAVPHDWTADKESG
jgi:hypothetical protein